MESLSSFVQPIDALEIELVKIKLWQTQEDFEVEYYDLPDEIINQLREFISKKIIFPEIEEDLRLALKTLPAWCDLSLEDLSKEQRECTASVYVRSKGRRLDLAFSLGLNANVF